MRAQCPFSCYLTRAAIVLIVASLLSGAVFGRTMFDGQSLAAKAAKSPSCSTMLVAHTNSLEIKLPPTLESSRVEDDIEIDNLTGLPIAVYRGTYRARPADPETQAREYLGASAGFFGLTKLDLAGLRLHAIRSNDTGTVVRLRQTWKGLPVNKNAEITIHITRDNVVDFVMNGFQYGIELQDTEPIVSSSDARRTVMERFGSLAGPVDRETSELMVLRHQGVDYLVHRINLEIKRLPGEWEALIDAKSGAVIKLEDISHYRRAESKARTHTAPLLLLDGTGNIFDPDPLTTATAAYGGAYVDNGDLNDPVFTAQHRNVTLRDITLTGNNNFRLDGPWAQVTDFELPNKGLFEQATPAFNYNRADDAFEAVNCYYHIDTMMRYLNTTLGLNIDPYQYQTGVQFDPSGFNGADNSHYLSGSGRLAFGEGGVDDAEDADVIIHELGHGLHDWVTVGGISQVNGLSEGTGDYAAGSYSRVRGFWVPANAAYHWTFNWDGHNPFWPGRVLNYAPTYPGGLTGQIHTDGQIWATAMMKIWDDIGAQKADKAFWAGMAMTNGSTNQNTAANAVFAASGTLGYTFAERTAIRNRFVAAGYTMPPLVPPFATVSGRVLRNVDYGLNGAIVTMTDNTNGAITISKTGSFGYFVFVNVQTGRTYTVGVLSKQFTYASQQVTVNDNVTDLTFTPTP